MGKIMLGMKFDLRFPASLTLSGHKSKTHKQFLDLQIFDKIISKLRLDKKSSKAADEKLIIFSNRLSELVLICEEIFFFPDIAKHEYPAGSPYPFPDGPAAPVSVIHQSVEYISTPFSPSNNAKGSLLDLIFFSFRSLNLNPVTPLIDFAV